MNNKETPELSVSKDRKTISWKWKGGVHSRSYSDSIIGYEILRDGKGFFLLEPYREVGNRNAVLLNWNGDELWRLDYPKEWGEGICFDRVGYSRDEFLVFAIIDNRDVGVSIDLDNFKYLEVFSAR